MNADPRELFARMPGVDSLEYSSVWPIRIAFDPKSWLRYSTVERVPLSDLCRTQRRVYLKYLNGKGNDRTDAAKDRPWLVLAQGRYWIVDGHHRVADAVSAGETAVEAYVRVQSEEWQS
jgi:hypothetical protein